MDPQVKSYIDQQFAELAKKFVLTEEYTEHAHLGYDQTKKLTFPRVELMDQATIVVNATLGSHFFCTLTGSHTLDNPSNAADGQRIIFELIQDSTGSRVLTLGSKFVAGPWTITLTTTASKRDFIEVVYSAAQDKFYVINFQKGY